MATTNKNKIKVPFNVGVFDIETTNLHANGGRILATVVLDHEGTKVFRADDYAGWREGKRYDDSEIVADVLEAVGQYDVLIGHNAVRFDIPFLNAKALEHGYEPLPAGQKVIDPVRLSRRFLRLNSNRLDTIARFLKTKNSKTPLDISVWMKAALDGDPDCLEQIVVHCIADCKVLAEVMSRFRGFVRNIDSMGSWRG